MDLASLQVDCAPGYYCREGAATRYPEDDGTDRFGPCPAGHYCPQGSDAPIACAAGYFNPQTHATSIDFCLRCPPGYLCEEEGLVLPYDKCPAGTFCQALQDPPG